MKDQKEIEKQIDNAIKIFKNSMKRKVTKKRINFYRAILILLYKVGFEEDFKSFIRVMGRKID